MKKLFCLFDAVMWQNVECAYFSRIPHVIGIGTRWQLEYFFSYSHQFHVNVINTSTGTSNTYYRYDEIIFAPDDINILIPKYTPYSEYLWHFCLVQQAFSFCNAGKISFGPWCEMLFRLGIHILKTHQLAFFFQSLLLLILFIVSHIFVASASLARSFLTSIVLV